VGRKYSYGNVERKGEMA